MFGNKTTVKNVYVAKSQKKDIPKRYRLSEVQIEDFELAMKIKKIDKPSIWVRDLIMTEVQKILDTNQAYEDRVFQQWQALQTEKENNVFH